MVKYNYNMCWCSMESDKLNAAYYAGRFCEEFVELLKGPCIDELSDCMLLLSLLLYSVTGVGLVLPYAGLSLHKGRVRIELHGCVRSYRNRCTKESC